MTTSQKKIKSLLSSLLRFGLSAVLLIYIFSKIDAEQTLAVVKTADIRFIIYAFLVFFTISFLLLLRWSVFIKALKLEAPFFSIVRYFFIGLFGNLFLPSAIGGDVIKIFGLCRYSTQKAKVVASVLLDRLSGFAGMVGVATAAFLFGHRVINDASVLISIVAMAGASAVIGTVLFHEGAYSFCCQVFARFPRVKESLMKMHYDIALLKDRPAALLQAVGISALSQVSLALTFFFISKALHQDVPLFYFIIFVPLICVASTVPSIGGLGVREAGTAYLLAKVGVASGVAVSISLINFLFMVLMGLLGGLFYVSTNSAVAAPAAKPRLGTLETTR